MKSHILLMPFAVVWVFGCGGSDKLASSHSTREHPKTTEPPSLVQGTIAQNETVMDVKDAFAVWSSDDEEDVLSVFFFPTLLSDDEKARMASLRPGSDPFFVTANKESHDPAGFQWYPYIKLAITFEPEQPRSSERISDVFLSISKIEDTGTHSIPLVVGFDGNMNPIVADGHETLETNFTEDGRLSMRFTGNAKIVDNEFSWNVELNDQPVVE